LNENTIQISQCFHSDLCQALWPTGKGIVTYHWAMSHRLKITCLDAGPISRSLSPSILGPEQQIYQSFLKKSALLTLALLNTALAAGNPYIVRGRTAARLSFPVTVDGCSAPQNSTKRWWSSKVTRSVGRGCVLTPCELAAKA